MLLVILVVLGAFGGLGGIGAVLALSGMSKYLAASRSAEAKSMVTAIGRAAVAAYDNGPIDPALPPEPNSAHRLCDTATPVPATLASVRGTKYRPSPAPGVDFETGDSTTGWKCLRFSVSSPIHYRYRYTQGSGYLVPSLAPGVNGFEASAQGDLDADGVPSTFALTGKVEANGAIAVSTSIYTEDELE